MFGTFLSGKPGDQIGCGKESQRAGRYFTFVRPARCHQRVMLAAYCAGGACRIGRMF
jgi:hypothetical protein